eukprot:9250539-Pyramimonas_sp.AAC.1
MSSAPRPSATDRRLVDWIIPRAALHGQVDRRARRAWPRPRQPAGLSPQPLQLIVGDAHDACAVASAREQP